MLTGTTLFTRRVTMMHNGMQRMRQLTEALNSTDDELEREAIQEEIWLIEEEMEVM